MSPRWCGASSAMLSGGLSGFLRAGRHAAVGFCLKSQRTILHPFSQTRDEGCWRIWSITDPTLDDLLTERKGKMELAAVLIDADPRPGEYGVELLQ